MITLDHNFIVQQLEISDSRPHTTPNITSDTSLNEYNQNILQRNPEENTDIFRESQPIQHEKVILDLQQDATELQNLQKPSDTFTIQNASDPEPSEVNTNNQQNFTITDHSSLY